MHRRVGLFAFFLIAGCLGIARGLLADRITLKDGTVLDGTAIKEKGGYWFKGDDGQRKHLLDDDIAKVEKGSFVGTGTPKPTLGGGSVRHMVGSLAQTKQRADD